MAKGIPTKYAAVQFRSRLEAKWARFFDLCRWKWSYEPYDLDGWIPDFALGDRLQTLVEVKPVMSISEVCDSDLRKIVANVPRWEDNGCFSKPVIMLGADPTTWLDGRPEFGAPCIGMAVNNCDDGLHFGWTEGNEKLGLCSNFGAWLSYVWQDLKHKSGRVSGGWNVPNDARTTLVSYWRDACNHTQWMAAK